jgi:hypothetical protein
MKKLLLVLSILFLSQFQISIHSREAIAQDQINSQLKTYTYFADGMSYRIFAMGDVYNSSSIGVVNITKEKLEIEKLKLEIALLKKSR